MEKLSEKLLTMLEDTIENYQNISGENLEHLTKVAGYLAYASVDAYKAECDYLNKVRTASSEKEKLDFELLKSERENKRHLEVALIQKETEIQKDKNKK